MARIKKKKQTNETGKKNKNLQFYIIIFLLLLQTAFLTYKNFDTVKDIFSPDVNIRTSLEVEPDNSSADRDIEIYEDISGPVRINILNGCGVAGLAGSWKDKLRELEYDVRETGNASKDHRYSLILSRIKNMKPARQLARKLGIEQHNVIQQLNKDLVDIDLTLILGSDHSDLTAGR